jgi:hypothetical protein
MNNCNLKLFAMNLLTHKLALSPSRKILDTNIGIQCGGDAEISCSGFWVEYSLMTRGLKEHFQLSLWDHRTSPTADEFTDFLCSSPAKQLSDPVSKPFPL